MNLRRWLTVGIGVKRWLLLAFLELLVLAIGVAHVIRQVMASAEPGGPVMSVIDVVVSLAMFTRERAPKGTVYQHTHFLRPALNDDFHVEATVLRFGKATAFAEARVTFASSGELVAHATAEFAF